MKNKIFFIFLVLTFVTTLYAADYPYIMKSTRSLGMGGAYYSLSNDKYAPFYNPAGLGLIEKWRVDLLDVQFGVAENTLDFYKDAKDVDWDSESEVADLLRKYIGEHQNISLALYPAFYKKNFMIGVFGKTDISATPRSRQYPKIDTDVVVDYGVVAGISKSFMDDKLIIGVAGKYLYRKSIEATYTVVDLSSDDFDQKVEDDLKSGQGFLADLGAMYIFKDVKWTPKLSLAVNNIGMTSLGDAKDLKTTVNIGAGISPKIGIMEMDIVADFTDVLYAYADDYDYDNEWEKRVHAGIEIRPFKKILALRAGINQGNLAYGLGINLYLIKIDYAFYKEEIGYKTDQLEDERHMLQVSIGF